MILNQVLNRMTIQVLFSLSSALLTETLRCPGSVLLFLTYVSVCQRGRLPKCVFQTNVNASSTLAMKHFENILPYLWMRFPGPFKCIQHTCLCITPKHQPLTLRWDPAIGSCDPDRAFLRLRSGAPKIIYIYIYIRIVAHLPKPTSCYCIL